MRNFWIDLAVALLCLAVLFAVWFYLAARA